MLFAGKAASAGIAFLLLTMGTSGPHPAPLRSRANLSEAVPGFAHPSDVIDLQQTLQNTGHYRGKVDGVVGLRTRASIRAYQKAENLPVTGQLDTQTAGRLGVPAEVRDEISYQTRQAKPSAGVTWTGSSGRKRKQSPKDVKRLATTVPPA
jgi:peptidoglycan hydrolase-like protein with peptidoglycan-binding domain